MDGLRSEVPDTNIVMIYLDRPDLTPDGVSAALARLGVWILPAGPDRLRAVTHLDVDDVGIERAVHALQEAVS